MKRRIFYFCKSNSIFEVYMEVLVESNPFLLHFFLAWIDNTFNLGRPSYFLIFHSFRESTDKGNVILAHFFATSVQPWKIDLVNKWIASFHFTLHHIIGKPCNRAPEAGWDKWVKRRRARRWLLAGLDRWDEFYGISWTVKKGETMI